MIKEENKKFMKRMCENVGNPVVMNGFVNVIQLFPNSHTYGDRRLEANTIWDFGEE